MASPTAAEPAINSRLDIDFLFSGIFELLNKPVLEPAVCKDSIVKDILLENSVNISTIE